MACTFDQYKQDKLKNLKKFLKFPLRKKFSHLRSEVSICKQCVDSSQSAVEPVQSAHPVSYTHLDVYKRQVLSSKIILINV